MRLGKILKISIIVLIIGIVGGGLAVYFLFDVGSGFYDYLGHSEYLGYSNKPYDPVIVPLEAIGTFSIKLNEFSDIDSYGIDYSKMWTIAYLVRIYTCDLSIDVTSWVEYDQSKILLTQAPIDLKSFTKEDNQIIDYTWTAFSTTLDPNLLYCFWVFNSWNYYQLSTGKLITGCFTDYTFMITSNDDGSNNGNSSGEIFVYYLKDYWIAIVCGMISLIAITVITIILTKKYRQYRKEVLHKGKKERQKK